MDILKNSRGFNEIEFVSFFVHDVWRVTVTVTS